MSLGSFYLEKNQELDKKRYSLNIMKKKQKQIPSERKNENISKNKLKDKILNYNGNYNYKNPFSNLSRNSDSNLMEKIYNKNLHFGNYDYDYLDLKKVKSLENPEYDNQNKIKIDGVDIKELNSYGNKQNFLNKSIDMDEKIKNIFNNQRGKIKIKISKKTVIENDIIIEEDPNNNEEENK
jgi:hypothetical protein